MSSRATPLLFCAAAALAGCDACASASTPDAGPAPTASARPTAAPSASPAPAPSSSAAAPAGELKVLKLVFTSEVKDKEPGDKLEKAPAGKRVYAHLTMRNRTPDSKAIKLVFLVNGTERSKIDLDVAPSWSYRTWGYVTLRDADLGQLVAEVRDDQGTVMERATLPIKGRKVVKEKGPDEE